MAKPFSIDIIGAPELSKRLAEFEPKVAKKLFRQASRRAAKIVYASAIARAPVQYGTLEASLRVKAIKRTRRAIGHEVSTREGMFQGESFYGGFVELGTKQRSHKSGKNVGKIAAQEHSFLRPALYDNEPLVRQEFIKSLRDAIREEDNKRIPSTMSSTFSGPSFRTRIVPAGMP